MNKINQDQINRLEELPQWSWSLIDDKWEEGFEYLLQFVKKEKHSRVHYQYKTKDGFALGTWVCAQKSKKRKKQLTTEQIERLEVLPEWIWDQPDPWEEGFQYLLEFVEREGHSRVPRKLKTDDGYKLGSWVSHQRTKKRKNNLTSDQVNRLEELPKWSWGLIDDKWKEGFQYLLDFVEQVGDVNVHRHFETSDGFKLGRWVSTQRKNKKANKLTLDQIIKLEALPNWSWDVFPDKWEEGFQYLLEFVEREGHSRVHDQYKTDDGFRLGGWVGSQRSKYKKGKLLEYQIAKLTELDKWSWDPYMDDWNKAFSYLEDFVNDEKHSRVHYQYKTKDGFALGTWVRNQKRKKRKKQLTTEQIERLEVLPEWIWDQPDPWEEGFQYLLEFVEDGGSARVHGKLITNDGFALGAWVNRQRMSFRKNKLTPDQIKKLEALKGWVWEPRKGPSPYEKKSSSAKPNKIF